MHIAWILKLKAIKEMSLMLGDNIFSMWMGVWILLFTKWEVSEKSNGLMNDMIVVHEQLSGKTPKAALSLLFLKEMWSLSTHNSAIA